MKLINVFVILTSYGILAAPPNEVSSNKSTTLKEFSRGNNLFTAQLYKEIIKEKEGNFIVSPFSAGIILALINEGAVGVTSEEIHKGLHLPGNKEDTQQVLKSILPQFKQSNAELKLLSANKIYTAQDVKLKADFNEIADNIYKAGVENINFSAKDQTVNTINEWVEQQTNNNIKNLIKPEDLNDQIKLILVNALYFKGFWRTSFPEHETHKDKFYTSANSSSEVDFMQQINSFKYFENDQFKVVEIPYKGDNIRLVIALPKEIDGLSRLEENLENLLQPQHFRIEKVDLKIPKLKIETEIKLNSPLEQLGIKKIFCNEADLSGLTSTHENSLYVDKIIQKGFIKIDEKGSEAAFATSGFIAARTGKFHVEKPKEFYADHPFVLYIKVNDIIIIAGAVKKL